MTAISKESRILLIDDSIMMRQMVRNILAGLGYKNAKEAPNGIIGLERIREAKEQNDPFRLIFLDWNMPEMDGLTFLKICRADPDMQDVPIVMLTAVSEQNNVIEALKSGVSGYITKPFSHENVAETMKQVSLWAEKHGNQ